MCACAVSAVMRAGHPGMKASELALKDEQEFASWRRERWEHRSRGTSVTKGVNDHGMLEVSDNRPAIVGGGDVVVQ